MSDVTPGTGGATFGDTDPAAVPKTLYDANSVLAATADDTPVPIAMGASTILARLAAGNIKAASVAEIGTLLSSVLAVKPGSPLTFTQTGSTTLTTVAADVNVGVLTLLTDAITAIGTLQTAVNDNRHLINALIDALQAAGIAL